METLSRGNGWKLMSTVGRAKAQVLDSCPLAYVYRRNKLPVVFSAF